MLKSLRLRCQVLWWIGLYNREANIERFANTNLLHILILWISNVLNIESMGWSQQRNVPNKYRSWFWNIKCQSFISFLGIVHFKVLSFICQCWQCKNFFFFFYYLLCENIDIYHWKYNFSDLWIFFLHIRSIPKSSENRCTLCVTSRESRDFWSYQ